MSIKKYKVRKKSKPIFASKKSGNSAVGIIIMIVLLAALVFFGYSIGKPVIQFFADRKVEKQPETQMPVIADDSERSESAVTEPESSVNDTDITSESEEDKQTENTVISTAGIMYISYPGEATPSYEAYIESQLLLAENKSYVGVCIELVCDGGAVTYKSGNKLAVDSAAITQNAISDLGKLADSIEKAGLVPIARISALSDHIVSWYDKGSAYMIEGSDSRWLDNSIANGGKPWLSPYSVSAQEYMSSLAKEISEAGFKELIASELSFPPLRDRDISYIGEKVRSETRYKALTSFSNIIADSFKNGVYCIEIDAQDIISGKAEVLKDIDSLKLDRIYIGIDLASMPRRISRQDGTEISFDGLEGEYFIKTVLNAVNERIGNDKKDILPFISGCEVDEDILDMLKELGYDNKKTAACD